MKIDNIDSYYVLSDFDRTLTSYSSKTSWSILAESRLMCEEYVSFRTNLYNTYRPIELDDTMPLDVKSKYISEWFRKHIDALVLYKITKKLISDASMCDFIMEFRNGVKEFLYYLSENNVPVIIISAGVGNFVEQFLINNDCYFSNIHIISNMIKFDDNGEALGVAGNIIHPNNKNETELSDEILEIIGNRENKILLGDQISDIQMLKDPNDSKAIKIGFCESSDERDNEEFEKFFDIVMTSDEDYFDVCKKINAFQKMKRK